MTRFVASNHLHCPLNLHIRGMFCLIRRNERSKGFPNATLDGIFLDKLEKWPHFGGANTCGDGMVTVFLGETARHSGVANLVVTGATGVADERARSAIGAEFIFELGEGVDGGGFEARGVGEEASHGTRLARRTCGDQTVWTPANGTIGIAFFHDGRFLHRDFTGRRDVNHVFVAV